MELAAGKVPGVVGILVGVEIADRFACGTPARNRNAKEVALRRFCVRWRRELELAVSDADEHEPLPDLGRPIICGVDDSPCAAVACLLGVSEDEVERFSVNLVREPGDVLEDEGSGLEKAESVQVTVD